MNNNDFHFKRMNKGIAGGEHKIIFKTPDGKIYEDCEITVESDEQHHHTCVVNLISTIKPKFKVGDIVTNISGLYPNVRCTITTVDEEKQCYYFREVAGVTYFKDQDKLMLVDDIKPKFKAGDKVKGASSENPEKVFVINMVNTDNKCYHYFNGNGIVTMFKDQDKLTLVHDEEVPPPVEDDDKLDILAKAHANNVKYNVLKYDIEHYPLIYNVLKQIIAISKEGAISYHLVVPMKKEADEAGVYYEEDEVCGIIRWHFDKLGYKIDEKVKDNYNEFFITW